MSGNRGGPSEFVLLVCSTDCAMGKLAYSPLKRQDNLQFGGNGNREVGMVEPPEKEALREEMKKCRLPAENGKWRNQNPERR